MLHKTYTICIGQFTLHSTHRPVLVLFWFFKNQNKTENKSGTYNFEKHMLHKTYAIHTRQFTLHSTHRHVLVLFLFFKTQTKTRHCGTYNFKSNMLHTTYTIHIRIFTLHATHRRVLIIVLLHNTLKAKVAPTTLRQNVGHISLHAFDCTICFRS